MSNILQVSTAFIAPGKLRFSRPIGLVIADDIGNQFEILERFTIGRRRDTKDYWANYDGQVLHFNQDPSWLCSGIGISVLELAQYFDQLEELMESAPVARVHLLKALDCASTNNGFG